MQTLRTLLQREESERDAAIAVLDTAQRQAQAAQLQAEQLLSYRAEYEQRWSRQFAQQGAIEILRCYHGFTQRLAQAIAQQQRVTEHAQAALERARRELQACELRVASVRKLIERRVAEEQRAAARRDQKQTDEAAARAGANAALRAPMLH
jgi:flagellar FliJ protein